jgi:hypothetical protein
MMAEVAPVANATEQAIFLAGRPPLGEFLQFHMQSAQSGEADAGAIAEQWRTANDHVRELELSEAGYADDPAIGDLPNGIRPVCARLAADPVFRRAYGVVPVAIRMVELDRLVVFQKLINLAHVARVEQALADDCSLENIFRACLPFGAPPPPVQISRVAPDTYLFVSPSNDLRFLEPALLRQEQVPLYRRVGEVAGIVGLVVGFTPNCFSVLHVENRLILINGSHRAYALRRLGHTHAPAVVQWVSRREELPVVGAPALNKDLDLYLSSPRPPVLKDYFDERLRTIVTVPRVDRQIKIVFASETIDLAEPA